MRTRKDLFGSGEVLITVVEFIYLIETLGNMRQGIGDKSGTYITTTCGIPQGTALGPLANTRTT